MTVAAKLVVTGGDGVTNDETLPNVLPTEFSVMAQ
jgi:hypothetical protein